MKKTSFTSPKLPRLNFQINLPIEDYLHGIDLALKYKTQREKQMIFLMLFGAVVAFAYTIFWDSSVTTFIEKQKQITALQTKILKDKVYLAKNPPNKITQIDKFLHKVNNQIITLKDDNEYIKSKIETISSLIYDEQAWGKYIYSISTNAQKYNIQILNFTNELAKDKRAFGHILDLSLEISGKYKDTLKFINALERSNLVVDLHDLDMKAKETLYTNMQISVWGIKY